MIRAPRAVVFDLDGTLIDSKGDIAAACNHGLALVGRAALSADVIAGFVGDGSRVLMARALGLPAQDGDVDRALAGFHAYYEAHPAKHTTVIDGVVLALDALRALPIAIVTNKSRGSTMAVLSALAIGDRFAAIRTGSDGPLKPDPAAIGDALGQLDVDPRDAWMVGDGEQDVRAGRAAGCATVGIRGGLQGDAKLVASAPDVILGSIRELPELFRRSL
jgi:phosphoglycolate phosphatase